mgnify:CR=1 FL=1
MLYQILNSFLNQTDPETAHEYAIKFLKQDIIPFDFFKFTYLNNAFGLKEIKSKCLQNLLFFLFLKKEGAKDLVI